MLSRLRRAPLVHPVFAPLPVSSVSSSSTTCRHPPEFMTFMILMIRMAWTALSALAMPMMITTCWGGSLPEVVRKTPGQACSGVRSEDPRRTPARPHRVNPVLLPVGRSTGGAAAPWAIRDGGLGRVWWRGRGGRECGGGRSLRPGRGQSGSPMARDGPRCLCSTRERDPRGGPSARVTDVPGLPWGSDPLLALPSAEERAPGAA